MAKTEELEAKIRQVVELLLTLRRENKRLHTECESLKGHVALLTGENNKAQRVLAEHEQIRRKHDQVVHRVERAIQTLNTLRR